MIGEGRQSLQSGKGFFHIGDPGDAGGKRTAVVEDI